MLPPRFLPPRAVRPALWPCGRPFAVSSVNSHLLHALTNAASLPYLVASPLLWFRWLRPAAVAARNPGYDERWLGSLSARWRTHRSALRADLPAAKLFEELTGLPTLLGSALHAPTALAHRATGSAPDYLELAKKPLWIYYQTAVTLAFLDRAVHEHLGGRQLVVLDAGFDTRALQPGAPRGRCFEVDAPEPQRLERSLLQRAGLDASSVRFVEWTPSRGELLGPLVAAGFDASSPALFLCEWREPSGRNETLEHALHACARAAPGSLFAFQYLPHESFDGSSWGFRLSREAPTLRVRLRCEPPLRERVESLLRSHGLALRELLPLSMEEHGEHPWAALALAELPRR